ncbi:hypothetical protein [Streptomyces sp. NBC_00986]|uniref:hypothetical protein n=1 Tax=Streptomyces sp. NBC_00986 TaxID=2903702 RepID=UPI00386CF1EF|nr:hypothetical protein OG504_06005 [Streptomyces sp. NBC_00986]
MATPRSAGRTLAEPERTGRTTYDRVPATAERSAGFRMTGHGRPDRAGAVDLAVSHAPRARKWNAPHTKNTLPHRNGIPGDRLSRPGRPTPVA